MRRPPLAVLALCALLACGGKKASTGGEAKPDLDADPFALIPPGAVIVARIDVHDVFASPAVGPALAALADKLVPLGEGSGFKASRDVDRAFVGSYATSSLDLAAVLVGHFDVDRIVHVAGAHGSSPIVSGRYAGFETSTMGPATWAPLTARTLVAGTTEGVHRLLDRVRAGKLERWEPPWMIETVQAPTAQAAVAADFSSQPLAAAALGTLPLPWIGGIRSARILGTLQPGGAAGLDVDGTLTYADGEHAASAAKSIRAADRLLDLAGAFTGGVRLQNFDAASKDAEVRCRFSVDPQGLRAILDLAPRLVPSLAP